VYICKKTNMDIIARKISFVQEFLSISDEDLIDKLEKILRSERKKRTVKEFVPMELSYFYEMIEKAEQDIINGKVTEAGELLNSIEQWK